MPVSDTTADQLYAERLAELTFELLEECQEKREQIANSVGLTVGEFKVMRVFRSNEVLSVGTVADRLELSSSRLTRIIDGLVQKGIVSRETSPDDRRIMELRLTDKGRKLERVLKERYVNTHAQIIALLPEGTPPAVVFAMEKLRDAMKHWSDQP
jgi:DNA-binding MarR family transcriptional regulator